MKQSSSDTTTTATGPESSDRPAPGKVSRSGALQLKASGGGGGRTLDTAQRGFGGEASPLPHRAEMESAFGQSFGDIRAYSDDEAQAANQEMGSRAYTVGNQIAFADAAPPKEIVAHELAHTIQQSGSAATAVQPWALGLSADPFESEADAAAASVMAGEPVTVGLRGPAGIQTWGGEDHFAIGNLAGQKATRGLPERPNLHTDTAASGTFATGDITGAPSQGLGGLSTAGERTSTRPVGVAHADTRPGAAPGAMTTATSGEASRVARVTTDSGEVSFGALTRAGGDYYRTPGEMRGLNRENDITSNWNDLGSLNLPPGNDFGVLADIGTTNANHFYPLNRNEYRNHHGLAMAAAARGEERTALMEEGFASHFLMDTFSSGHMAPRSLDSIGALRDPEVLKHQLSLDAMRRGVTTAAGAGARHFAGAVTDRALAEGGRRFDASVAEGAAAGEERGDALARWIGDTMGAPVTVAGYDINPISGAVVTEYTGMVTRGVGRGLGTVAGGVSGIATGARGIVDGATTAATDPALQGESVIAGAREAMGEEYFQDAYQGLVRTKDWHDYFCALPNGLPTDKGRFHGDHLMDGNDLEHVSNVCAGSLRQVLSALPNPDGTPGPGYAYDAGSQMPTPAFQQIMDDPAAGPAWRLMMQDYRADMARARTEVQAGDRSRTDGGTEYDSREVVDLIYQNVYGGSLDAPAIRTGTVATERGHVFQALTDVLHYLNSSWGANAGVGMNDDLNRPMNSSNPDYAATAAADPSYTGGYGAGEMQSTTAAGNGGRPLDLTRFNPWLMENRYGMFSGLVAACTRWVEACGNAEAARDVIIPDEAALATRMLGQAQALLAQARALPNLADSVELVDGAVGMGASMNRHVAGFMLEHGMADAASTVWNDVKGREFRAAVTPILTQMIADLRVLDPHAAVPSVGPSAEAAAAADLHL